MTRLIPAGEAAEFARAARARCPGYDTVPRFGEYPLFRFREERPACADPRLPGLAEHQYRHRTHAHHRRRGAAEDELPNG
jgi:hypothetical protein